MWRRLGGLVCLLKLLYVYITMSCRPSGLRSKNTSGIELLSFSTTSSTSPGTLATHTVRVGY